MKRISFFATLLTVTMLTAGVTAYCVNQISGNKGDKTLSFATESGIGSHFTSYQPDKYPDLTYAAENAVQAVVNIEVMKEVRSARTQNQVPDSFFDFFGIPQGTFPQREAPAQRRGGTGSGVIISNNGYIVTNHHVVDGADEVKVKLDDNKTFTAKIIGSDPATDIALLKIDATDLPTVSFGDSDALRLGEWVLAIGSPYGLQNTITAGIISAKARNLGALPTQFSLESFIQTDAAVNPGNSGGALVNTRGELVGINSIIQSPTGSYIGYSFAIPTWIVKKVVVDLKEYGVVQRAVLGITYREVNEEFIENEGRDLGIKEIGGCYVANVTEGGAAEAAGIKVGDVITQIGDVKIEKIGTISAEIAKHRPNDKVKIYVKRGGDLKQFDIVLRNGLGNTDLVKSEIVAISDALGGNFRDITDKAKKELKINGGVQVAQISASGILAEARIRPGYIITQINDRQIRSIADLSRSVEKIESIDGVYPDGRAVSYSLVTSKNK